MIDSSDHVANSSIVKRGSLKSWVFIDGMCVWIYARSMKDISFIDECGLVSSLCRN